MALTAIPSLTDERVREVTVGLMSTVPTSPAFIVNTVRRDVSDVGWVMTEISPRVLLIHSIETSFFTQGKERTYSNLKKDIQNMKSFQMSPLMKAFE